MQITIQNYPILTIQLGRICNLQGLLKFVRPSASGHLGALDEHKLHRNGAAHVLRFVGSRLKGEYLRRSWSHGELVDADEAETQELGRRVGVGRSVVDLEKDFGRLVG